MDFTELLKNGGEKLSAEKTETATDQNTARALGSGGLAVYGTPAMIALMEKTAVCAVESLLPAGWSTVGTELSVKHLSATPVGMRVSCKAELLRVEGRALFFAVEAFDEAGKIGEGTHSRFIVENERFMSKAQNKNAGK